MIHGKAPSRSLSGMHFSFGLAADLAKVRLLFLELTILIYADSVGFQLALEMVLFHPLKIGRAFLGILLSEVQVETVLTTVSAAFGFASK